MGTGIDMSFMYNDIHWKCNIYFEVKAPEQPVIINSQKIHESTTELQKKTILIVDDDQYIRKHWKSYFMSGFRTMSASQGQQAHDWWIPKI